MRERFTAGLGPRIKEARIAAGHKTGTAFAGALGVDQAVVSRYESEAVTPSVDMLARIAALCGVSTDWLITGAAPETPAATGTDGD